MKALLDLFKQVQQDQQFDAIKIGLASSEKIRSWSFGEVRNLKQLTTELLSQRERVVLCKNIRPCKDYECLCGKYKRLKHRGVVAKNVGRSYPSRVRRERMGHIELATPVAHIWF